MVVAGSGSGFVHLLVPRSQARDDWRYVFNGERPRPNPNQNAGIDISPAVRDFLGMKGNADVDWKFVEDYEVPMGPWARWARPDADALPPPRGP